MTLKVSTGLRDDMLDTASLKTTLALGFIHIYDGTEPADADTALSGNTLLCTISVSGGGTGLTFDTAAASGGIQKNTGETWQGTNLATGTASFYRHVGAAADAGGTSTTLPRIQGTVGTAGTDMNLSSTSLTVSGVQTIDYYTVNLPSGI